MVAGRPSLRYQALISGVTALLVLVLMVSLAGFWRVPVSGSSLFLYALAAAGFGWLYWRAPALTALLVLLGMAGAALATRYLPEWAGYLRLITSQGGDLITAFRQLQFDTTFGPDLGDLLLLFTAIPVAMLTVREALAKGNTFWSIALGTFIFGTEWAWYYDKSAGHFTLYAVLAFAVWVLGHAARRDAQWEATGRKVGYRSHVLTPLAWVLAATMVASILPAEFGAIDLGALGEKAQEAFPILRQLRGGGVGGFGGRFSLRATGFSPALGTLGGPVKVDNTVALHLMVDEPMGETAYLRGITFSTYNGQTWLPGEAPFQPVSKDGSLASAFGPAVMRDFYSFKVSHALNMGTTLFNQLEPMSVKGLKSGGYKADPDGNLLADRSVPRTTPYEVTSRIPTYSAEQIRALSAPEATDPALKPYLQVPATMPQRISQMARSLTEPHATPYDKAVAIESYLRGMRYDLDVPAPPRGRDFVDFFLFDLQRGYCVYYATAMTVMLREVGIPSRFVEGFAVPPSISYTEGADGTLSYPVVNSQAHAWVEAYFPGYGWVTFDPTPRTDLPLIDRSTPAPSNDNTGSSGTSTSPTRPGDEIEDPGQEPTSEAGLTPGGRADTGREWPWALTVAAALAGLLWLGYRRLQAQDRITASEGRLVTQEAWDKTTRLMHRFGFGRRPSQTAQEYAQSIGKAWPSLREQAEQVAEDYTVARYGPPERPADPEAPPRARQFWSKVLEALFHRYGWRIYLWRRIRWQKNPAE